MNPIRCAEVLGMGIMTSVGLTAPQTAAAVRAGISRFNETPLVNSRTGEPVVMGILRDEYLPPLHSKLAAAVWSRAERQVRMVRLAGAALQECLSGWDDLEGLPLLLAVPETLPGHQTKMDEEFFSQLALQSGSAFDVKRSRCFANGRAAGVSVFGEALRRIEANQASYLLVGGVDTHVDVDLIHRLTLEDRIRGTGVHDGFIPGEGAAIFLLGGPAESRRLKRERRALLRAVGMGEEPGHRYSPEIHRGDGLTAAFQQALAWRTREDDPIQTVFAGLNGENLYAKEWGIAYLRHRQHFADDFKIQHPADCLGDTGAAMGPLMLGIALVGLQRGYVKPPCLIWCASDLAPRGALLISGSAR